mmetsp:Transcript_15712/g.28707  ORF Transcript_15712/g.28707 Transcript_15712/m.28707 type:complete len:244 (+) Transcript_15712:1-732(+)
MQLKLTLFDCFSLLTLAYFIAKLVNDWGNFHCQEPIEVFMFGCCMGLLGLIVSVIMLRNSTQQLWLSLFTLAFIFFGLLPFTLVWTVIGTIWYCRLHDLACIPDDIRNSGILPTMLFANYIVSSLGGMLYCAGLYVCCKLRAQSLSLFREFSQGGYEMSHNASYMPLEQSYIEQLDTCTATTAETQGTTCSICYESFENQVASPIKLPICNHIYHEACIKNWFKLRSTCPNCRSDLRQVLNPN